MANIPPEPNLTSDNLTLNMKRPSPRSPAEPIHSSWTTNSPPANTSAPRQTFNPDGTRKYLNIRPAGGQPFPLKKGKKYLAEDYKDGVEVKKEGKGAASSAPKSKPRTDRVLGSRSPAQDEERVIKQEVGATSRGPSSVDSDSSPERPLIEVSRSVRKDGRRAEDSAIGAVEMSGDTGNKSEDDRGRKLGRDVGNRCGGTRGVKRQGLMK